MSSNYFKIQIQKLISKNCVSRMEKSSADGVSGSQIVVCGSNINQEAPKFHSNLGTSAVYDPRKLYMRENLYTQNEQKSSSGNQADNVGTSSNEKKNSNLKRKMEEDSHQARQGNEKKRNTRIHFKKYLLCKISMNDSKQNLQNIRESSSSSKDSCSDSDTEISSTSSSNE